MSMTEAVSLMMAAEVGLGLDGLGSDAAGNSIRI